MARYFYRQVNKQHGCMATVVLMMLAVGGWEGHPDTPTSWAELASLSSGSMQGSSNSTHKHLPASLMHLSVWLGLVEGVVCGTSMARYLYRQVARYFYRQVSAGLRGMVASGRPHSRGAYHFPFPFPGGPLPRPAFAWPFGLP